MAATKRLRAFVFWLISFPVIAYISLNFEFLTGIFCIATCVATYFLTQDVLSVYNNARLTSRINTIANAVGLSISLLLRFLIVKLEMDVSYLAIPIVTTTLIPYLIRLCVFKWSSDGRGGAGLSKRTRTLYIKYMVYAGLPLAVSGISVAVYSRLSQLILVKFNSSHDLGIYSAANTLATSWAFIPAAFITSFFSLIYSIKDKENAMLLASKLNGYVLLFSMLVCVSVICFGRSGIEFLYGDAYVNAYPIFVILTIATGMSSLGSVVYRFIIRESGYSYLSFKMFFVFIINLPLSYMLVKYYGLNGAAYAVLATEFLSLTVFNYFFQRAVILKIHTNTFNPKTYIKRSKDESC